MRSFEKWERFKGGKRVQLKGQTNGLGVGIIEIENKIFHWQVK